MQIQRLFSELCLLLRRERVTCEELARRYEVSQRTIYRDLDTLSGAGIPVYTQRGRGGGVSLLPGFALPRTLLTPPEQRAVLAALQGAAAAGADGAAALETLAALFAGEGEEESWLAVDFSPWGGGEAAQAAFYALKEAILEHQVLRFAYYSAKGEATQREVEPRQLLFKGQAWYLWAWCRTRADWRFFKLLRMEDIRPAGATFAPRPAPPPAPDPARTDFGRPLHLQLRFAPAAAYRLREEFAPAQLQRQADGGFLAALDFPDGEWLYSYLLSFGDSCFVQSPARVRRELARRAAAVAARAAAEG